MADDRYRDYGRPDRFAGRGRGRSIFSDDDNRWRGSDRDERGWRGEGGREWRPEDYGWGRRSEPGERGFFERARDEVRSWFGDEEDERRREMDDRRGERYSGRSAYGERSGGSGDFGGERYRPTSWGPSDQDDRSGGYRGPGREQSGTSHFDENYRRWRDQQIAELDREYEEYCRERQQRFESDFHSWRSRRQGQSGTTGGGFGEEAGQSESGRGEGAASGNSALLGSQSAGATTAGGGEASAMESSTGSSPEGGATGGSRRRS